MSDTPPPVPPGAWCRAWRTAALVWGSAALGYSRTTENPAFFPLYPLLMRITDPVLPGHRLAAGLILAVLVVAFLENAWIS